MSYDNKMDTKISKNIVFYKRNSTIYARLKENICVYLMPLRPTDAQKINHIWDVAEEIHTYPDLISICRRKKMIRIVYTEYKPWI